MIPSIITTINQRTPLIPLLSASLYTQIAIRIPIIRNNMGIAIKAPPKQIKPSPCAAALPVSVRIPSTVKPIINKMLFRLFLIKPHLYAPLVVAGYFRVWVIDINRL
jgi:hypothetical protein